MARKKKTGRMVKKARAGAGEASVGQEEAFKKSPHSFVFHRGLVGKNIKELVFDVRRVMEPYTASHLKAKKNNVLKDFVAVAGPLNVTHFMIFTKTDAGAYLHVVRLPRGPTMTFKLADYCLSRDVISSLKRHNMETKQFQHHPLLVMNNFSGEGIQLKLMTSMFQNMFPSLNINSVKLRAIRRCVLLQYNPDTSTVDFRHYNIRAVPVGVSRGVKKLIRAKVPNLGRFNDISDFMLRGGDLSESEAELDGDHNEVELPQALSSRGNIKAAKSAIRLTEIGPRLSLQLVKIEDGVCDGEVLFHKFVQKTVIEKQELKQKRDKKKKQKQQRRQTQDENIKKKIKKKEENKQRSLDGMKRQQLQKNADEEDADHVEDTEMPVKDDRDEDIDYFRQEVGEEPDPELFPKSSGFKRKHQGVPSKAKKWKGPPDSSREDIVRTNRSAERSSGGKSSADWGRKTSADRAKGGKSPGDRGKDGNSSTGRNESQKAKKKPLTDLEKIKRRKVRAKHKMERSKKKPAPKRMPRKK